MGQRKRIRRGTAGWRKLISRHSSSGLSVARFCHREQLNAGLFRRWQSRLSDAQPDCLAAPRAERTVACAAPFIDLGDIRSGGPRLEVRLDLGGGLVLSIARG